MSRRRTTTGADDAWKPNLDTGVADSFANVMQGNGVFAYGAPSPDPYSPRITPPGPWPNINTPGTTPISPPTPNTQYIFSIWEKASECKHCGAPIYSRRDPLKPGEMPEIRFNCNCRLRDTPPVPPKRKRRRK